MLSLQRVVLAARDMRPFVGRGHAPHLPLPGTFQAPAAAPSALTEQSQGAWHAQDLNVAPPVTFAAAQTLRFGHAAMVGWAAPAAAAGSNNRILEVLVRDFGQ